MLVSKDLTSTKVIVKIDVMVISSNKLTTTYLGQTITSNGKCHHDAISKGKEIG